MQDNEQDNERQEIKLRCAVHQPNYLPWSGFFHKMASCDVLIILDNVQYSRRSFCNRTQVKSPSGALWLTLPIVKGPVEQEINQTRLFEPSKHLSRNFETLRHLYARAPYFSLLESELRLIYHQPWEFLLPFNLNLIRILANILEITTPIILASNLGKPPADKNQRIIFLCQQLGADTYLSGIGAKAYNDPQSFITAGLTLEYQSFQPPVYSQGKGDFISGLSIIDLIAYAGPKSRQLLT